MNHLGMFFAENISFEVYKFKCGALWDFSMACSYSSLIVRDNNKAFSVEIIFIKIIFIKIYCQLSVYIYICIYIYIHTFCHHSTGTEWSVWFSIVSWYSSDKRLKESPNLQKAHHTFKDNMHWFELTCQIKILTGHFYGL